MPEKVQATLSELFLEGYKTITQYQFDLSYYANISIKDSDNMSHPELMRFYSLLRKQKEAEKEANEEAVKNAK